ncbi:MAG: hypothetical protein A2X48_12780 [Lentisphaerae bacterium GWF2_49_21]|nr:MAG: hypothetical protein A2X48_12780 [Lentisphaerae bacterium GWF2_49_21]
MKIPDGWFIRDMIIFNELDDRGWAAKGYVMEIPDFRNASNSVKNELHNRLMLFLSMIRKPVNVQFQWSVDSDYRHELMLYDAMTEKFAENSWTYSTRKERFTRYWNKMLNRQLRREKLKIYLSTPIEAKVCLNMPENELERHYGNILETLSVFFTNQSNLLYSILGSSDVKVVPMGDNEHYLHYTEFLNPDHRLRLGYDPLTSFDRTLGIQENCWNSAINGNRHRNPSNDYSFFFDGYYHGVLVVSRWPQTTYPGIICHLTGLPILDYAITMDIWPQKIEDEIKTEEAAIERLSGDYHSEKKHSLLTALDKKHRKVNALAGGFTYPFKVLTVIRTWAQTKEELASKCSAIKSAVNLMNGAGYWESSIPTTSMNLFFMTWPGWTFGKYTRHGIYAENQYLADMLPVSATFTGHLEGAESIYDGGSFNLIGIRNFIGGTPQHAALFGMSGAGKSSFMVDLLSQTECFYDYTCIIEEGLSYGNYTRTLDTQPIVIHPDSDFTINYLDTSGLPLSSFHLATATALLVKMTGTCSDEKRNLRASQLMQYLDQLYTDTYGEWLKSHEDLLPEIIRRAICVRHFKENLLPPGSTVADAYVEMTERIEMNDGSTMEFLSSINDQQMTEFSKGNDTEKLIRDMAFTYFKADEYPTHSALQEMMIIAPFRQHDRDEVKQLATLISSWCAYGQYGKIFDGATNISLTGKMAHFELGSIPDEASDLKKMVGFLINSYTRNHIMTLPRNTKKRYVFEEAGRILDVEGGERLISECYAQMRKYGTWIVSIVQQYSKFKQTPIRPVIMGNSKQFFLMKQNDRSDLADISRDIDLSEVTQEQIMNYPSPENLPEDRRHSSFTYYHLDVRKPICGSGRNYCSSEMLACSGAGPEQNKCKAGHDAPAMDEKIKRTTANKKEDAA